MLWWSSYKAQSVLYLIWLFKIRYCFPLRFRPRPLSPALRIWLKLLHRRIAALLLRLQVLGKVFLQMKYYRDYSSFPVCNSCPVGSEDVTVLSICAHIYCSISQSDLHLWFIHMFSLPHKSVFCKPFVKDYFFYCFATCSLWLPLISVWQNRWSLSCSMKTVLLNCSCFPKHGHFRFEWVLNFLRLGKKEAV